MIPYKTSHDINNASCLIKKVFCSWANYIDYVLIRGWDGLNIIGSDIDILIANHSIKQAEYLLEELNFKKVTRGVYLQDIFAYEMYFDKLVDGQVVRLHLANKILFGKPARIVRLPIEKVCIAKKVVGSPKGPDMLDPALNELIDMFRHVIDKPEKLQSGYDNYDLNKYDWNKHVKDCVALTKSLINRYSIKDISYQELFTQVIRSMRRIKGSEYRVRKIEASISNALIKANRNKATRKKRNAIFRVAIVGPDGAGKSSVANALRKMMKQSVVLYAGKKDGHLLFTTTIGYNLWMKVKKTRYKLLSQFIRFYIFYPLEYLENLYRFRYKGKQFNSYIYDRHPVDRMVMIEELKHDPKFIRLNSKWKKVFTQYSPLLLWKYIYRYLFPSIDLICFLMPDAELCFERSTGHYKDIKKAERKIKAYSNVSDQVKKKNKVMMLDINNHKSILDICATILKEIPDNYKKPAWRSKNKSKKIVLFGAMNGKYYGDNSRHLFEWVLQNRSGIGAVWVTRSKDVFRLLDGKNYPVVLATSKDGLETISKAKIGVFTNSLKDLSNSPDHLPDSIKLIALRHGRSVKKVRFAREKHKITEAEASLRKREGLLIQYAISTSQFVSDMQEECLRIGREKHIVTGYPRNDFLLNQSRQNRDIIASIITDSKIDNIVLYAPSWRHGREATKFFPFSDFKENILADLLCKNNTLLLLRPHVNDLKYDSIKTSLFNLSRDNDLVKLATHADFPDVNTLLPAVDILISDYSALYHDFLLLDKPMVFVPYDFEEFKNNNGFLYDYYNLLPGPAVYDFRTFCETIDNFIKNPELYSDQRKKLKKIIHDYEDNKSSKRVTCLIDELLS